MSVTEHVYANWRNLIKPRGVERDPRSSNTYGKFVARPLERGFGITIGNSLRRVLLSSLQGCAVTRGRIDGVLHEFSSIPGVVEDVTDVVLNLKGVLVKTTTTANFNASISKNTEGLVTAGDLVFEDDVAEVLNPDHPIATITACHPRGSARWRRVSATAAGAREPVTGAFMRRTPKGRDPLLDDRLHAGAP